LKGSRCVSTNHKINVGGQIITSMITSDAARELGLKKGVSVYALVKATEVMVSRG